MGLLEYPHTSFANVCCTRHGRHFCDLAFRWHSFVLLFEWNWKLCRSFLDLFMHTVSISVTSSPLSRLSKEQRGPANAKNLTCIKRRKSICHVLAGNTRSQWVLFPKRLVVVLHCGDRSFLKEGGGQQQNIHRNWIFPFLYAKVELHNVHASGKTEETIMTIRDWYIHSQIPQRSETRHNLFFKPILCHRNFKTHS